MIKTRAGRARANVESATIAQVNAALAKGDQRQACDLLYAEAKRQGVALVASRAGMQRPALHHALHKSNNPTFTTLLSIMAAIGLILCVEAKNGAP